jgi:hypothetical protein
MSLFDLPARFNRRSILGGMWHAYIDTWTSRSALSFSLESPE